MEIIRPSFLYPIIGAVLLCPSNSLLILSGELSKQRQVTFPENMNNNRGYHHCIKKQVEWCINKPFIVFRFFWLRLVIGWRSSYFIINSCIHCLYEGIGLYTWLQYKDLGMNVLMKDEIVCACLDNFWIKMCCISYVLLCWLTKRKC